MKGEMKDTILEKRRLLQLLEERKHKGRYMGPLWIPVKGHVGTDQRCTKRESDWALEKSSLL